MLNTKHGYPKLAISLSVFKQGVSGEVNGKTDTAYTLPVSYSSFFVPVTGFGQPQTPWYPDRSALIVRKGGLTSIYLTAASSCFAYVITIGM